MRSFPRSMGLALSVSLALAAPAAIGDQIHVSLDAASTGFEHDIDAGSIGREDVPRIIAQEVPLYFSVDRVAVGGSGTPIQFAAQPGVESAHGDLYATFGAGTHSPYREEIALGLSTGFFGDDVDALQVAGVGGSDSVDTTSPYPYWALWRDSARVGEAATISAGGADADGFTADDIALGSTPGNQLIFASGVIHIGLMPGDDLDGLVLMDVTPDSQAPGGFLPIPNGIVDPGFDKALFSLDPFSPNTITAGGGGSYRPGDVLYTDFSGSFSLLWSANALGLDDYDNVDALSAVPEPTTAFGLLTLATLALRPRRRHAARRSRHSVMQATGAIGAVVMIAAPALAQPHRHLADAAASARARADKAPLVKETPAPGAVDLETAYQGYASEFATSSAELDLNLDQELIRFTAWTAQPASRFEDYSIDVRTTSAGSWQRLTTAFSDRVVFDYADTGKNMRVHGDVLLAPHWRAVVDTAPIDPQLPMDNLPSAEDAIRWTLVRAPNMGASSIDMRPMPFGVINTVAPIISVPIGVITSSQGQIWYDDGWDETADAQNVTGMFVPSGVEAVASLPFLYGANRLTFVFPDGQFETFSLNYTDDVAGVDHVELGDSSSDFIDVVDPNDPNIVMPVLENALGIYVEPNQPEETTSAYLREFRFQPSGHVGVFHYYQALIHGQYLSDDENSDDLPDLITYFGGDPHADARQLEVFVDPAWSLNAFTEILPAAIRNNNATMGYNVARHGWNDPNAATEPASGLDYTREHFWMDTPVAHRLVARWFFEIANPPATANLPVVAVADSGLGNGAVFPNGDLPANAFYDIYVGPGDNTRLPERVNTTRGTVTAAEIQDPRVADNLTVSIAGHGTQVAECVVGRGGTAKRGIGVNSLVTVYKVSGWDVRKVSSTRHKVWCAQAIKDPEVRVLNLSNGIRMAGGVSAVARRVAEIDFDQLSMQGVISAIAAGNNSETQNQTFPGIVAPTRGMRNATTDTYVGGTANTDAMSSLMVRVAGVSQPDNKLSGNVSTQESAWANTGTGGNITVAAAGRNIDLIDPTGFPDQNVNGTSFATPITAGLLAEVVRILDLSQGPPQGPPANAAARRGRAGRARQAIEIVEATADRALNRNVNADFDVADGAPNNNTGYGRINAWKAMLSAINGGLAAGGTDQSVGAGVLRFPTLNQVNAANTTWYGMLFRLQSNHLNVATRFRDATVWLDTSPFNEAGGLSQLSDTIGNTDFVGATNGGALVRNIIAYKALTHLNVRTPFGFPIAGGGATGTGVHELIFSSKKSELDGGRRLELRRNADGANMMPFFSLPLNLANLRNNTGPNGANIRFDDFVFEVLVDHVVTFNRASVQIPAGATALPGGSEVTLTVTVVNASNAGVAGVPVKFIVVDTNGAENGDTQVRLRPGGGGAAATNQTVNTVGAGTASVLVTRIAAGAGGANPQGTTTRIRIEVPITGGGGSGAGAQFQQEFTVPVTP
ncbi:MAG: S8/S53 family peptidase [Phycisphaerales bacterium]|nr:S8/S53 family peptidase [Phycisphaerales bacterium]